MLLDDEAFRDWVAQTHAASLQLARRIVANEADAADVVQESYVRAYAALRSQRFRSGPEALAPWLRRIVTRASLDALRARGRRREQGAEALEELASPIATDAGEDRGALERALLDLPSEQRAAFVLREVEGFSAKETAEQLGCTVGAVEQRVIRAWAGLRRRLNDGAR
jgi:RNA polymerase sigma-70 factor (ECF subfamily)